MQTLVEQIVYISDMFGTAVFAFSGVWWQAASEWTVLASWCWRQSPPSGRYYPRHDPGCHPVFWVRDPLYIWVVIATALIGMWMVKLPRRMPWYVLPVADAFGLALFTVIGAQKPSTLAHRG